MDKRREAGPDGLLEGYLTLLDGLCAAWLSTQEAQCPGAFQGRGVVIPESQVSAALSGRLPAAPQPGFAEALAELLEREREAPEDRLAALLGRAAEGGLGRLAVALALAPEVDRKYERIFGYLQDSAALRRATVGLLADLYGLVEPVEEAALFSLCAPDRPLARFVLELEVAGAGLSRPLALRRGALLRLTGADHLPEPLPALGELLPPGPAEKPLAHKDLAMRCARFAAHCFATGGPGLLELYGADGTGRRFLLRGAVREAGRDLLCLDCGKLSALDPGERRGAVAAAASHCFLSGAVPVLCRFGAPHLPPADGRALARDLLEGFRGAVPLLAVSGEKPMDLGPVEGFQTLRLTVPPCTIGEQRGFWTAFARRSPLPLAPGLDPLELAGVYALTPGQIERVLSMARAEAVSRGAAAVGREDVSLGVRALCAPKLAGLTQPLTGGFTWDDLMLEPEQLALLHRVCDRFRYRWQVNEAWGFDRKLPYGRGVSVLLYGPPGTGKTMTAQVLAREFGLDAYRVDMSRIMDKYIGETEKKLAELFDAAKDANAILFFDEADALFAKRTEVADSKDRYANAETAYLLQRMEAHNGISILATNAAQNFDEAFKRRISYMVHLPMPSVETRKALWRKVFPEEAPLQGVDLDSFAQRFELSGSSIKNVALSSAFLAAAGGGPITREHLVEAVKEEYRKTGRVLMEHELY